MEQKFKKLLQKSKAWQESREPLAQTFEGAIFAQSAWPFHFMDEEIKTAIPAVKTAPAALTTPPKKVAAELVNKTVLFLGDSFSPEQSKEDLLGKMIAAMKLQPSEFVRFPFNEALEEISRLEENLHHPSPETKEIFELLLKIKPGIIVTLGATITNVLLGRREKLSGIHGQFLDKTISYNGQTHTFTFMPLFHPDFLLINPNMKRTAWIDLQKVMERVGKI